MQLQDTQPVDEAQRPRYNACRERIARLYRLAYLITGDPEQSFQVIDAALNVSEADPDVRKLVVAEALKRIDAQLKVSIWLFDEALGNGLEGGTDSRSTMAMDAGTITPSHVERALVAIDVFPRCVVLLTVFERFSDKETSIALSVNERLVKLARAQGLIELTRNVAAVVDEKGSICSEAFRPAEYCQASIN